MRRKKVLVAMSGGVDSSLAAAILKRKGYEAIGATMKLWPESQCVEDYPLRTCCSLKGIEDARLIAAKLDIPHYVFDFYKEFKDKVIDYFCGEYSKGATPNPCIVCNQRIKFDLLLNKAIGLGCEYIATGHYARTGYNRFTKRFFIKEGKDKVKDQSYFLSFISQKALARTIFPLGSMLKTESRQYAKKIGLRVYNKRGSQEICFIRNHYVDYLRKWSMTKMRPGDILNSGGERIATHKGIYYYTIGQRKGLGIAYKEPLYVIRINRRDNTITVGTKKDVMKRVFTVKAAFWYSINGIKRPLEVMAKIRYGHKKAKATVVGLKNKGLRVSFEVSQEAPTPGQAVVFYKDDMILGGGWIDSVLE